MRIRMCAAAAGALALTMAGAQASACEDPCGYGSYGAGYYGPPVYSSYQPAAVYAAPPVYAYSYYPEPAYAAYPGSYGSYYTTRINIFPGPAWGYSAAYYSSSAGGCRRVQAYRPCHVRRGHYRPQHRRHHMYGPIIHASRRW
jgi:hypothetical protein